MRRLLLCLTGLMLALSLTGCTVAAFWLSGCDSPDADLVVINNSGQDVWSITLDYGTESRGIRSARDQALLEQGLSYGLTLEEGTDRVTVILSGRSGRELGRTEVDFAGERLYLTLERGGSLSVSEEWPHA